MTQRGNFLKVQEMFAKCVLSRVLKLLGITKTELLFKWTQKETLFGTRFNHFPSQKNYFSVTNIVIHTHINVLVDSNEHKYLFCCFNFIINGCFLIFKLNLINTYGSRVIV